MTAAIKAATKRTGWMSAQVKPVRRGWYEGRMRLVDETYSDVQRFYFDGRNWPGEKSLFGGFGEFTDDLWRGLARNPTG